MTAGRRVLPGYRLELEFDDGVSGTVDLSEAVGKGVFALWRDPLAFDQVRIGSLISAVWPCFQSGCRLA